MSLLFLRTSRINLDSQTSISDTVNSQKVALKGSSSDRSLVFLARAHSFHTFTAHSVCSFVFVWMLASLADCTAAFPFGDAYTRLALVEVTVVEAMVTDTVHVVLAVTYWLVDVSVHLR